MDGTRTIEVARRLALVPVVGALVAGCSVGGASSTATTARSTAPTTASSTSSVQELPTTAPAEPTTTSATPSGSATPPSGSSTPPSGSSTPPSASPTTTTAAPATPGPAADQLLRPGAEGARVLAAQRRLTELGYWLGTPDGVYGAATVHAVTALQKAAGLGRDGVLGPRTRSALDRGVRPQARSTAGHVVEIDLARQVLTVVDDGAVTVVLDTSTGSNAWYTAPDGHRAHATTPVGSFAVSWSVDGWHTSPLGHLYRPRYFHSRGIAVHGYTSVPPYPASHGCVRVTMAAMDLIWRDNLMPKGGRVMVY